MVSERKLVGFRGKPEGLENLLEENGYELIVLRDSSIKVFEQTEGDITLHYTPDISYKTADEDYEWRDYPEVTSDISINYYPLDPKSGYEEAQRIASLVTKRFGGVMLDWDDNYYEADDL